MAQQEGRALTLLHLLNNQCLLPVFRIYCRSHMIEEFLDFWLEVRGLVNKHNYEKNPQQEADDTRALFTKYFHPDSLYHIEVEPKIYTDMLEAINNPDKLLTVSLFTTAHRYVFDVLDVRGRKPFATSESYKNFLKRENSLY